MRLPLYIIDAFAQRTFEGNPAAVCPLPRWLPDALLASIAAENNLSETAFYVPHEDGYAIRWFTPAAEVDLCGHATLATAFVLAQRGESRWPLTLHTREVGPLSVDRDGGAFVLDFPSRPSKPCQAPDGLPAAIGSKVVEFERASKNVARLAHAQAVRDATVDFDFVTKMGGDGLIITAEADDGAHDFVSRYFAPHVGIDEDPVTGSAHCTLTPFWAQRLGKTSLRGRQVSKRGGTVGCRLEGDRVFLRGEAVAYMTGEIEVDDG